MWGSFCDSDHNGTRADGRSGTGNDQCLLTVDEVTRLARERDGEGGAQLGYNLNGKLQDIGRAEFKWVYFQASSGQANQAALTANSQARLMMEQTRLLGSYYRKWQMRNPYPVGEAEAIFRRYFSDMVYFRVNDTGGRGAASQQVAHAEQTAKAFILHAANEFYCMTILKYDRVLASLVHQTLPQTCPAHQVAHYKADLTQRAGRAYYLPLLGQFVSFGNTSQLNAAINACRNGGFAVP